MLLEYDEIAHIHRRKRNVIDIQVKEVRNSVSAFTGENKSVRPRRRTQNGHKPGIRRSRRIRRNRIEGLEVEHGRNCRKRDGRSKLM